MSLRLDWCDHKAAKYAVENWHYSKSLPTPPIVRVGVWESGKFIGCVLFSRGAAQHIGKAYNLPQTNICELTRVALSLHIAPVSRIVALAIKMLKKHCPELRLIVSYADPLQGHAGGIYQAGNWIYEGKRESTVEFLAPDGKRWHGRMISPTGRKRVYGQTRAVWKPEDCKKIVCEGKHKYLMPLDDEMRKQIAPLAKPYPKRLKEHDADTLGIVGGATPTQTLQFEDGTQEAAH